MHYRLKIVVAALLLATLAFADGGYFIYHTAQANSASQRAILLHDTAAGTETMVLSTMYAGTLADYGWVIPVPTLPASNAIAAYQDDGVFDELDYRTAPSFFTTARTGCQPGCAGVGAYAGSGIQPAVQVVDHLTLNGMDISTLNGGSGEALTTWLNANQFTIPANAPAVLQYYIDKGWGFVTMKAAAAPTAAAMRQGAPTQTNGAYPNQLLALTFTTDKLVFPLRISAVSSRPENNEVLLYVFDDHRVKAANLPTVDLNMATLNYETVSGFQHAYDAAFAQEITQNGQRALVVEYAAHQYYPPYITGGPHSLPWKQDYFLTRLHTKLTAADMQDDIIFANADADTPYQVQAYTAVNIPRTASLGALALLAALLAVLPRRRRLTPQRAAVELALLMVLVLLVVSL